MKNMLRKITIYLICVMLLTATLPYGAMGETLYPITINGVQLTDVNFANISAINGVSGGIVYQPPQSATQPGKLVLNGAQISQIDTSSGSIVATEELIIELTGTNNIVSFSNTATTTVTSSNSGVLNTQAKSLDPDTTPPALGSPYHAISGNLIISGSAELRATAAGLEGHGVDGNVTISGSASLNASGHNSGYGINGALTLSEESTVQARGADGISSGTESPGYSGDGGDGINGSVTMSDNAVLDARGGNPGNTSSGDVADSGYGINGGVNISGGRLTANGAGTKGAISLKPVVTGSPGIYTTSGAVDESSNYISSPLVQIFYGNVFNVDVTQEDIIYGQQVRPTYTLPNEATDILVKYSGTTTAGVGYNDTNPPTDAGDYSVSVTATVGEDTHRGQDLFTISPLGVSVVSGDYKISKIYDGTTNAGTPVGSPDIVGAVSGDDISVLVGSIPPYTDKNVHSESLSVTVSLDGADQSNYALDTPSGILVLADITPKAITLQSVTADDKTFDGNDIATVSAVEFLGLISPDTLSNITDYTVENPVFDSSNADVNIPVDGAIQLTATGSVSQNYSLADGAFPRTTSADIRKAVYGNGAISHTVHYNDSTPQTVDISRFIPINAGNITGIAAISSDPALISTPSTNAATKQVNFSLNTAATAGNMTATVILTATVQTQNYQDFNVAITVNLTDKTVQKLSFNSSLRTATLGDLPFVNSLTGLHTTATYASTVPEVATVDADGKVTIKSPGITTIIASAAGTLVYTPATAEYLLTVNNGRVNPSSSSISSTFEGDFSQLQGVQVDLSSGETHSFLTSATQNTDGSYDLTLDGTKVGSVMASSIKVTLLKSFYDTLPSGTHAITVTLSSGHTMSTTFLIPTTINSGGSSGGGGGSGGNTSAWYPTTYPSSNDDDDSSGGSGGTGGGYTGGGLTWNPPPSLSTGGIIAPSSSSSSSSEESSESESIPEPSEPESSSSSSSMEESTEADADADDGGNELLLPIIIAGLAAVAGIVAFIILRRRNN